jgi:hypothetical protein
MNVLSDFVRLQRMQVWQSIVKGGWRIALGKRGLLGEDAVAEGCWTEKSR